MRLLVTVLGTSPLMLVTVLACVRNKNNLKFSCSLSLLVHLKGTSLVHTKTFRCPRPSFAIVTSRPNFPSSILVPPLCDIVTKPAFFLLIVVKSRVLPLRSPCAVSNPLLLPIKRAHVLLPLCDQMLVSGEGFPCNSCFLLASFSNRSYVFPLCADLAHVFPLDVCVEES